MAIDLTLKSVQITARDAVPPTILGPGVGGEGMIRSKQGFLASVTLNLSITSVIRMFDIDSHAVVSALRVASAAQTAGKVDIGLYRTTADGGAVVDQDFFATAVDLAGAVVLTDVLNESTTNTLVKQTQPLWQAAGMTTDPGPGTKLDVCLTVVTTDFTTAAGAVLVRGEYVI